ncbi:MAG: hypothetical protein KatS3mg031_1279 [Chitinophagales bacterium]|nr:MAG: hypothetical protein KatS3mg031_1279 [Chitinophagales bacterium]
MKIFLLLVGAILPNIVWGQTLGDYQRMAVAANPGLQAKYLEFEAALKKIPQAATLPDPTLAFGYMILHGETRVGPQRARLSLMQMFPWFGTLAAQKDAAALMAEAKYQSFLDARNELFYKVSAAYFPLYELNQMIRLQKENMKILTGFKTLAISRFQNGKGTMADVLRADLMINDLRTDIAVLEIEKKPLEAAFNQLLNRATDEPVVISDSMPLVDIVAEYRFDSLLIANPKLAALQSQLEAAKAQEKVAVKQGLPKVGLGLDYVVVSKRTDMEVPDNGKDMLMPMLSVSLPIYRKKYTASRDEARLMQQAYAEMKQEVSNSLVSAYEMAWFELQKSRMRAELYKQQITQAQQTIDLLLAAYGNSGKEFEEVLRMQQQLLKYQMEEATAVKDFFVTLAQLDYLTAKAYGNE